MTPRDRPITDDDFEALARFGARLRRFLASAERAARAEGVTPAHHQLLLAIRGHPGEGHPSMTDLADALQRRRHTVVELVDRAVSRGLVTTYHDPHDRRRRLVALTPEADAIIGRLAVVHRRELAGFRAEFTQMLDDLE